MDSALICLYALQKLTDNPLINVKSICLLICTSKIRIGEYVLYFIHKNKIFKVNLDFRVDLSKYTSVYVNSILKKKFRNDYSFFKASLRQEFVLNQVQVQWSRYRHTIVQLHCTGTVVHGYRYNIQVQVKVQCTSNFIVKLYR